MRDLERVSVISVAECLWDLAASLWAIADGACGAGGLEPPHLSAAIPNGGHGGGSVEGVDHIAPPVGEGTALQSAGG